MAAMTDLPDVSLSSSSAFVQGSGLVVGWIAAGEVTGHIDAGAGHHTPWGVVHGGAVPNARARKLRPMPFEGLGSAVVETAADNAVRLRAGDTTIEVAALARRPVPRGRVPARQAASLRRPAR